MRISRHPSERLRVIVASMIGLIVAVVVAFVAPWQLAVLTGWNAAAITVLAWIWLSIAPLTATETRSLATREDDSRVAALVLLILASVISLVVVILTFIEAERSDGVLQVVLNVSGVAGVLLSWTVVHTVFTLRYAHVFYNHENNPGGIDFPGGSAHAPHSLPDYRDFAYVAFTVGMTFQVSDTDIDSKPMRRVILIHALLSWLFGAIIVATTINLIANLLR
ncbi:MAG: DUF1345 domain-containing protein [Acidimicrobiales bacterium]